MRIFGIQVGMLNLVIYWHMLLQHILGDIAQKSGVSVTEIAGALYAQLDFNWAVLQRRLLNLLALKFQIESKHITQQTQVENSIQRKRKKDQFVFMLIIKIASSVKGPSISACFGGSGKECKTKIHKQKSQFNWSCNNANK